MTRKSKSAARPPLTDDQLEEMLPSELFKLKLSEDEIARLRKINESRNQERETRVAFLRIEERPLVAELRAIDIDIDDIGELINRRDSYASAVPILLKHLTLPYSDPIRNSIARSLAVPEPTVIEAWPLLVQEYKTAPIGKGFLTPVDKRMLPFGAKDGLACTLSATVTEETLPELIELLKDQNNGTSRVLLLSPLKKRRKKSEHVRSVLADLVKDPDLAIEISSWK